MIITAEPRSDQWNADDFVQGPRTFTIAGVSHGKAEQKYDIALEGSDRVWRPPLTVLRILLKAWGDDATKWVGHQVTLYRDESVKFGPDQVGGIRVSHLSHIDKALTVPLTTSRGRRANFTVKPLEVQHPNPSATTAPDPVLVNEWISVINEAGTMAQLEAAWKGATTAGITRDARIIAAKDKRKTELA